MGSLYEALRMRSTLCITTLLIMFSCIIPFAYKMCAVRLLGIVVLRRPQTVRVYCVSWLHQEAQSPSCPIWICVSTFSDVQTVMKWLVGQCSKHVPMSATHVHTVTELEVDYGLFCLLFPAQHSVLNGGFEHHTMTIKSPCRVKSVLICWLNFTSIKMDPIYQNSE